MAIEFAMLVAVVARLARQGRDAAGIDIFAGGSLTEASELAGGVSARVFRLDVALASGKVRCVVLRQYGAADLAARPNVAAQEYTLLRLLEGHQRRAKVPAPRAYLFDESSEILASPYIVTEYMDGATASLPAAPSTFVHQVAAQLCRIHQAFRHTECLDFLPSQRDVIPARLATSRHRGDRVAEVLCRYWPPQHQSDLALLHGDYWPGNILWQNGRISGVIDWEDAVVGDPLADVANCRLELLWAMGEGAMEEFTHEYAAMSGIDLSCLPEWDLYAAVRLGGFRDWVERDKASVMGEKHDWFVQQAVAMLGRL